MNFASFVLGPVYRKEKNGRHEKGLLKYSYSRQVYIHLMGKGCSRRQRISDVDAYAAAGSLVPAAKSWEQFLGWGLLSSSAGLAGQAGQLLHPACGSWDPDSRIGNLAKSKRRMGFRHWAGLRGRGGTDGPVAVWVGERCHAHFGQVWTAAEMLILILPFAELEGRGIMGGGGRAEKDAHPHTSQN